LTFDTKKAFHGHTNAFHSISKNEWIYRRVKMSQANGKDLQQVQRTLIKKVYIAGVSDNQDYDLAWCPADNKGSKN
jgi:hypothetical protein